MFCMEPRRSRTHRGCCDPRSVSNRGDARATISKIRGERWSTSGLDDLVTDPVSTVLWDADQSLSINQLPFPTRGCIVGPWNRGYCWRVHQPMTDRTKMTCVRQKWQSRKARGKSYRRGRRWLKIWEYMKMPKERPSQRLLCSKASSAGRS